jgi:hypothetical protein
MFGFFISELYVPICRFQLKKHCLDNITARRAHVTAATTEHTCFTECTKKSTKPGKHSVNSLPSVTLHIKEVSVKCTSATVFSEYLCRALHKWAPQWAYLPIPLLNVLGGTRQELRLYRVPAGLLGHFVTSFVECISWHSAKFASLPSVAATTTNKLYQFSSVFFAKCYGHVTRQSTSLTRIPFYLFLLFHRNKQMIYSHIYHKYHRIIMYMKHTT